MAGFLQRFARELDALGAYPAAPVIDSLRRSVQAHPRHAGDVIQLLETRVRAAPPAHKVPLWYLIDALVKHKECGRFVGAHVAKVAVATFTAAYEAVGGKDKARMRRLLETWRQAGTFSASVLRPLGTLVAAAPPPPTASAAYQTPLQARVAELLAQMQREMGEANPVGVAELERLNPGLVQQLREEAQRQLSSSDSPAPAPAPAPSARPAKRRAAAAAPAPAPAPAPEVDHRQLKQLQWLMQMRRQGFAPTVEDAGRAAPPDESSPVAAAGGPPPPAARPPLPVVRQMYGGRALQCKTCGLRFADPGKLSTHMDAHFKENRMGDGGRGASSRAWFSSRALWTMDQRHAQVVEQASFFGGAAAAAAQPEQAPALLADSDDDGDVARVRADESVKRCPVCHESFKRSWDDDEGEWFFLDAVRGEIRGEGGEIVAGVFHSGCYKESRSS